MALTFTEIRAYRWLDDPPPPLVSNKHDCDATALYFSICESLQLKLLILLLPSS